MDTVTIEQQGAQHSTENVWHQQCDVILAKFTFLPPIRLLFCFQAKAESWLILNCRLGRTWIVPGCILKSRTRSEATRKTKHPLSIDVEGLPCLSNNLSVGVEYRHNDITDYPRPSWAFVSKESVGIFLGKDCGGERELWQTQATPIKVASASIFG